MSEMYRMATRRLLNYWMPTLFVPDAKKINGDLLLLLICILYLMQNPDQHWRRSSFHAMCSSVNDNLVCQIGPIGQRQVSPEKAGGNEK